MEKVELPIHEHPLLPIARFSCDWCKGCGSFGYIYGGYRCNELGCGSVFHRECAESLPEIKHSSHPYHPLKLFQTDEASGCSRCGKLFKSGYICSICDDVKLDLRCAQGTLILEKSNQHQHPLELFSWMHISDCKTCEYGYFPPKLCYNCSQFDSANHTSHPQHPLKLLTFEAAPDYADKECILCKEPFDSIHPHLHHCDVCNFSICTACMKTPPPVRVESPTTHEHQLHLFPRRISFTCNACGTLGDKSPYLCLHCHFVIHRQCIDLPRVININHHDHRISYTRRLGHGEWECKVCREKVDGFYGAYTCDKCPSFAVHSRCATREDVWDMIELEGMPEEEETAPFEVIDANTIKHFSHDHNLLRINKDGHGRILSENIVCEACRLQIISEPFYSCKQCTFILHEECANHPRKKRSVINNLPFTLLTYSLHEVNECSLCEKHFTGFRYKSGPEVITDVQCAAISDTLEHGSHQHPLYYYSLYYEYVEERCIRCGDCPDRFYRCVKCDYTLDGKCAHFPKKVMRNRYDDHPLFLSFGEKNVVGDYWCEACETKVNPKEWFYTCNDCGTTLHISCVVGDFSYIMPGSHVRGSDRLVFKTSTSVTLGGEVSPINGEVVSNTSICRPICSGWCNSRCKIPSILKISWAGVDVYVCSIKCRESLREWYHQQLIKHQEVNLP